MQSYEEAFEWVAGSSNTESSRPQLLLGNGFSVAHSADRFTYRALLDTAQRAGSIGPRSQLFFDALDTYDFELVIEHVQSAALALEILDSIRYQTEIEELRTEATALKETLARTLAGLHPERPSEISDDAYARVRHFLSQFRRVYTANYDLLLYWAAMHDLDGPPFSPRNDGFRDPEHDAPYVVWDYLDANTQEIYYLHGALHLYRDSENAELQKLTWIRTQEALIDQIRAELDGGRFPLIITEGTSTAKLAKIQSSDYLSKALRSLVKANHGMIAYGLSFSANDAHITHTLVRSTVQRLAVGIYGDPDSEPNQKTIAAVSALPAQRASRSGGRTSLEVEFFDAGTLRLWR